MHGLNCSGSVSVKTNAPEKSLCIEMFIEVSRLGSSSTSLRYAAVYIKGNSYLLLCANEMTLLSIFDRAISVCNLDYHNTGKFSKVTKYPVVLLTEDESVFFSWIYIPVKSE